MRAFVLVAVLVAAASCTDQRCAERLPEVDPVLGPCPFGATPFVVYEDGACQMHSLCCETECKSPFDSVEECRSVCEDQE